MITFLKGVLVEKQPTRVVLEVQGVGYEVFIPLSSYDCLPARGDFCTLLTHDYVREDTHQLFGFMSAGEREMFVMLLGTSGVGPRLALSSLSGLSVRELKAAIVEGDVKRLSSISGVGRKTAERLVVDLRHKFTPGEALEAIAGGGDGEAAGDMRLRDASLALVSLGYKDDDARKMIQAVASKAGDTDTVEDLIRKALSR